MRRFVTNGTAFVDPAGALAHEVATHLLKSEDVSANPQTEPDIIYVSRLTPEFIEIGSKFLGRDISSLVTVRVINRPKAEEAQ
jgi:glutamate racemase